VAKGSPFRICHAAAGASLTDAAVVANAGTLLCQRQRWFLISNANPSWGPLWNDAEHFCCKRLFRDR